MLDDDFDVESLSNTKLGYYIGSFDPIHLGHQFVIDEALKHVDTVLIYPAPGGDSYKRRIDPAIRLKMIQSIYQNHPRVLFTHWSPKELQDRFSKLNLDIVGIIGSDVVTETLFGDDKELSAKKRSIFMRGKPIPEKYAQDTIGAIMALKANSFLVALRGDIDLSYLDNKIEDRPILAFIQSGNISSTEVKKKIQAQTDYFRLLSPEVKAIIEQEKLYQ